MDRRQFGLALAAGALSARGMANAQGPGVGPGPGKGAGPGQGMGPGADGPGKGPGMMQQGWTRERMFGTRLMTLEERQEHMQKMWNAKSVEERVKIRDDHRRLMLDRAKQRQQTIDEKQDDLFSVPERK